MGTSFLIGTDATRVEHAPAIGSAPHWRSHFPRAIPPSSTPTTGSRRFERHPAL